MDVSSIVQYNCELSGGVFDKGECACPLESFQTHDEMYDETTGFCQSSMGGPAGDAFYASVGLPHGEYFHWNGIITSLCEESGGTVSGAACKCPKGTTYDQTSGICSAVVQTWVTPSGELQFSAPSDFGISFVESAEAIGNVGWLLTVQKMEGYANAFQVSVFERVDDQGKPMPITDVVNAMFGEVDVTLVERLVNNLEFTVVSREDGGVVYLAPLDTEQGTYVSIVRELPLDQDLEVVIESMVKYPSEEEKTQSKVLMDGANF